MSDTGHNSNGKAAADAAVAVAVPDNPAPKVTPAHRQIRPGRFVLVSLIGLVLITALAGFGFMALTGKSLHLPVWVVAEAETRINRAMDGAGNAVVSLGSIVLTVDRDWTPRLRLEDVRLSRPGGAAILTLPEARVAFAPGQLFQGQLRARSLALVGARVRLRRGADGRFDLQLGAGMNSPELVSFGALLDRIDDVFKLPALSHLEKIEAEAMTLTLEDARARRVWQVGDGRLTLENRADEVAMELGFSVLNAGGNPAQAVLTMVSQKASGAARLRATVDQVPARDIAAQAPPLAWLSVLDAPISGKLSTEIDENGKVTTLDGTLTLAAGALQPTPETRPIVFDRAGLTLSFDPGAERISLTDLTVESPSLRIAATGQVYVPGVNQGLPDAFLGQVSFSRVMVDPEGLFEEPVTFSQGALDMRLRLDPFRLDLGQLVLVEDGRHLQATGHVGVDPKGWTLSLDLGLDEIRHDRLLALWPVGLVAKTRDWLSENVQEGLLYDVKAALRLAPEAEPRLSLGYEFADGDVRFLKTLPPIKNGYGYATIEGNSYTMVLDRGQVTPPEGGMINMSGTVFSVLDILQHPPQAEVHLLTDSSLTAALSLLDEPPFGFMTKAGKPVNLGQGRARLDGTLRLPLKDKVQVNDVSYGFTGQLDDVSSTVLVPGKTLSAKTLQLTAGPSGLRITGQGALGKVPFDGAYQQPFTPNAPGRVTGRIELSPTTVSEFNLGLPDGMLSGKGTGQIDMTLTKGESPKLSLVSDLRGVTLSLPDVGWTKPADGKGSLTVEARLGTPPTVDSIALDGAGLRAQGSITLRPGGGLDRAVFTRFTLSNWLDAQVQLTGNGKSRAVGIALTDGTLDLRRMTLGGKGGSDSGSDLDLRLSRVTVSEGIALTGFRGKFNPRGGFNGSFTASVNQAAPVQGTVVPTRNGSAVRIRANDAGAVLAAAGVFTNARGGSFDMQLTPTGADGTYDGVVKSGNIRVRNAPALAELLNAISVVGALEQLNGSGLTFASAEAAFRLSPKSIVVTRSSAVGASLGVSMSGVYVIESKRLDMRGVISPIYLLNGIGAILTRKGEGLFGFNYRLTGTSTQPDVSVNPLSILTPGMFREIFRTAPPKVE